ncbi:MAG: hypothetical protein JWP01_313 [Myxococcales bacterium]|nr:hypothetical protein [Myxococcales bacterium]
MRTAGILFTLCLVVGAAAGCKAKSEASAAPDPAAVKAQQELVARRDALLAQREKLQSEATKLAEEIQKKQASGEDTSELAKKKADIDNQIEMQEDNLTSTSSELSAISTKLDAAGGVVAREAKVADREKLLAQRERELAQREKEFLSTQTEAAKQWKDSCSVGGGQTIIQQVAPPKSGTYSRKEVDGLVGKARSAMTKKNLISSDLGPQASLESEVTKALSESDWTRGYILASQLVQTIDAIQINRQFINAKYQRLHNRVKAAKVDETTQAGLDQGMREIMQKFGDGDFTAANKRINQLWSSVK